MSSFLTDIETLRARAREHVEAGPVTDAYGADLPRVVAVLQEALATELLCVLRYRQHHYAATVRGSVPIAAEFLEHALEEQGHADRIAARISQLGAVPDFDPDTIRARAHSEFRTADDVVEMLTEDLVAERVAVATYTEIFRWLGDSDPTTRRMLEDILANEEEHAEDLLTLMTRHA